MTNENVSRRAMLRYGIGAMMLPALAGTVGCAGFFIDTDSKTTLVCSATTASYGTSILLTATVAPSSSESTTTPTGTVTFYYGSTSLGSETLSSGVATLTTTELPVGTDVLKAVYGGDTTYEASTSAVVDVTITEVLTATTTTLVASPSVAASGATVTLSATLSTSSATGTVLFYSGTTVIGSATVSAGLATITTTTLATGTDTLTAVYSGDTNYLSSTSASVTVDIVS